MKKFALLSVALVLSAAVSVQAQNLNIDFCVGTGSPAATYGAAGFAGFWNNPTAAMAGFPLNGLNGLPTGATISGPLACGVFAGPNSATANASSNPGDAQLMNDIHDGTGVWTINGLAAGTYTVLTYAAAPDTTAATTNVSVNGAPNQLVGGTWGLSGGTLAFTPGITHASHTVSILAGQPITITTTPGFSFASLNGIQITPEPSTLGLLAVGALALIRRRK
jgi:hypothetical protein